MITFTKAFDLTVLFFIFLNGIVISLEKPTMKPDSLEREILNKMNHILTAVFTFEMIIKVVSQGFFIGKHTYLSDSWNKLDFVLVVTSLVDTAFVVINALLTTLYGIEHKSSRIFGVLRVLRILRTLRPLKVISRAPGLKLVVATLFSSLQQIGNIVFICASFFIIFGILGVQMFKGKYYYCDGVSEFDTSVKNKDDCLARKEHHPNTEWRNQRYNFDDLGGALMSLFVLASKDGWVAIMHNGVDAVGVDKQPMRNNNPWMLFYFISFLLIVGFFVLNMFVGVVVENFHRCRLQQEAEEKKRKAERAERKRKMKERRDRKLARRIHERVLSGKPQVTEQQRRAGVLGDKFRKVNGVLKNRLSKKRTQHAKSEIET